ncbi:restriction endonuclease subunit S [Lactobacillus crispatus]|uniref:restriction endonuclease subunit S n=1 Tax=Lactobacillus crispatus TaxID=47770 RepID=UPI003D6BD966
MTKNDDKRVPVLRFKGFNDDWAQRKLGDIANVDSSKRIHRSEYTKEGIPFFRGSEITDRKISNLIYISKKKYNEIKNQYGVPKPGDLLITAVGTIGNIWKVDNTSFYYKDGNLIHINPKCIDEDYLVYYFQFLKYKKIIDRVASGSNQKALTIIKVQNLKIKYPQKEGQSLIGVLLKKTENLIALQQRKLQQLKLLKKAMLQDLFTDKNVPKLRFNGFDANWIQCKLEKEALLTMGQSPSGSTYSDQPSTYILVQGNADLKNGWVKPRIWTTQITKLAKKGDIIITVRAPAGKVGRTNFDVVLGRGVASIQGNDFIFYLLSKMDMNKYWKKYAAGSTFESINSNDIKNTRVHVPNLLEQNRIANLFLRLDDLIRFQQNKLNNLQKTKQFLFQNMFI